MTSKTDRSRRIARKAALALGAAVMTAGLYLMLLADEPRSHAAPVSAHFASIARGDTFTAFAAPLQ